MPLAVLEDQQLISSIIVGVGSVVWWLLRQKAAEQTKRLDTMEANIADLYEKHGADVEKLRDLQEKIAREHYIKAELDQKFDKLEVATRDGFRDLGQDFRGLGDKIDILSQALINHISKEVGK